VTAHPTAEWISHQLTEAYGWKVAPRYIIRDRDAVVRPGQAEIAFVVIDAYQGQGIGTILMRHLAILARDAGLRELIAEVLPENTAMLKVFKKFGFRPGSKREAQAIHLTMQLA
jgi:ribosomal protein S18 acetylase RimI-like enzyme